MLLKLIISIIFILLGLWSLCAWIRLDPPANILLTLPKILYTSFISTILFIYLVLLLAYSFVFLYLSFNALPIDSFYFFSYLLLWLYTLAGFTYCDFIRHASVNNNSLNPLHEKVIDSKHLHKKLAFQTYDFSSYKSAKQFILYTPSEGAHKETCLVYLNYEECSVHPNVKGALYLRDLALKEGYSFCIYGGNGKEETYLPGIVNDIQEALAFLKNKTSSSRFILCGKSSSAQLALLSAFSDAQPEIFAPFPLQVDGIIALYPIVDLSKHYTDFNCKDIPILLIHGSHDSQVPIEPTRKLYEVMSSKHKTIDYLELPFMEHAFDSLNVNHSVVGHKMKREITNWLYTYFR